MPGKTNKKRSREAADGDGPRVIRKYSNRRLYDTTTGTFVTLEDLRRMVVEGKPFVVQDAKEGKDITPSILAQIIAEQQGRGESVLPGDLMRQLIAFYDNGMSEGFFKYLQESMENFSKTWPPLEAYNEMQRRNVDLFRKSYESFFGMPGNEAGGEKGTGARPMPDESAAPDQGDLGDEMAEMERKLDEMQKEIERLRAERSDHPSDKAKG
jgi:polyhydroxyalkanoate synthesis repressor PhaR